MRFVTLSYQCMVQHMFGVRLVDLYMMTTTTSLCCVQQYMTFNLHLQYVTFFCGCMQYIFVVLQMGSFISVKVWVYKIGIQFQLLNVPLLLYKS